MRVNEKDIAGIKIMTEKTLDLSFVTHRDHQIRQVSTKLSRVDRLIRWKARWALGRMKYMIEPGIYAVGTPDSDSPVFASANYKISFDCLRSQLGGRSGWILVLDTNGINVWCAASKGTFGTDELVSRIKMVKLAEIVNHRTLIVPQLGATGVSAHKVKQLSDFRVIYGPVRAADLPDFLDAGMKATGQMRLVNFSLWDRIVLIPVEIVMWNKYAIFVAACFFLLAGLNQKGYSISLAMNDGLVSGILFLASFLVAAIFGPILLPWLPGRAFSVKGIWIGLVATLGLLFYHFEVFDAIAWLLIIPAVTSFMVMNFTGASTYTSLSGVRREMKVAVPLQLLCAVIGIGLWLIGRFV
jgi:CO dehydrogenase/acetyl-CoA synthase delta subunit